MLHTEGLDGDTLTIYMMRSDVIDTDTDYEEDFKEKELKEETTGAETGARRTTI